MPSVYATADAEIQWTPRVCQAVGSRGHISTIQFIKWYADGQATFKPLAEAVMNHSRRTLLLMSTAAQHANGRNIHMMLTLHISPPQ